MQKQYKSALIIVTACLASFGLTIVAPANAAQKAAPLKPFMAGRVSGAVVNTILSGNQPPKSDDGIDGDFYIDTKALNFFGPKVKGRWPAGVSLRGTPGAPGSEGKNGSDGKNVSIISGAGLQGSAGPIGPRGDVGPQGIPGVQGARGEPGAKGEAGAKSEPGASGSVGPTGPQGASGQQGLHGLTGVQGLAGANGTAGPQGVQGIAGANGAQGVAGSQGVQGNAGAAGATGATGAAGSSNVSVNSLSTWSLSTSTAGSSADSSQFATLEANKSYLVTMLVHGVSSATSAYFGLTVLSNSNSDSLHFESTVSENYAYVGASFVHRYSFIVQGTIVAGPSNSWLKLRIVDGAGVTGGGNSMSLIGQAVVQLVSQVSVGS